MASHTVIHGKDLKRYVSKILHNQELADYIDPAGINIVTTTLLHNDIDIRAFMLLKVIGSMEPREVHLDFPCDIYNKITQTVFDDRTVN